MRYIYCMATKGRKWIATFDHPGLTMAVQNIMDTFTGDDGGVGFVALCGLLQDVARQARAGDQASTEIVATVLRFHRLIEVAKRKLPVRGAR